MWEYVTKMCKSDKSSLEKDKQNIYKNSLDVLIRELVEVIECAMVERLIAFSTRNVCAAVSTCASLVDKDLDKMKSSQNVWKDDIKLFLETCIRQ
jgi:hypothetical protein